MAKQYAYPLPGDRFLHHEGGCVTVITLGRFISDDERIATIDEPMVVFQSENYGSIFIVTLKEWNSRVPGENGSTDIRFLPIAKYVE